MKRLLSLALFALLALPACDRLSKADPEPRAKKPAASKSTGKSSSKSKVAVPAPPPRVEPGSRFLVPFAWEASEQEPLAQARSFLKEILTDNRVYMEHGPRFFDALADGQNPRATVLTCSDSRVHTPAFDTTPENDDFMIRNIGNQLVNSEGSVAYGVEHLETPVLLILGHTGCGAVQAALGDTSRLSEPIRKEISTLQLAKPKPDLSPAAAWSAAVASNVHQQIEVALGRFGARVQEGKLTVVGAIYDFRNDLGNGRGKLTIIDVNGNAEPERMRAFLAAVEADGPLGTKKRNEKGRSDRKGVTKAPLEAFSPSAAKAKSKANDAALIDVLGQVPGLLVQQSKPEPTASAR